MTPITRRLLPLTCLWVMAAASLGYAQEPLELIDAAAPKRDWRFDNGQEFPGAKGSLNADVSVDAQHRPALRVDGDFTGGGNYVQLGRDLPAVNVESLTLWIRAPKGMDTLTLRLIDGSGQCHQLKLRVAPNGEWQRVFFPIARYFEKAGTSASVESVARYEGWGGADDGRWHNPARGLYILLGRPAFGDAKRGSLWISGVRLQTAAPKIVLTKDVRLDDFLREGELVWSFNNGREFPGAKGGVSIVKDQPEPGKNALRLLGDFTKGGAYVGTDRRLDGLDVETIRLRVKTDNATRFNVRLGDGTGQCHQGHGITLTPDGMWHDVTIETRDVVGGEHWGGANDGRWHGNGQYLSILVGGGDAPDKKPELLMTDVRAEVRVLATVAGKPYSESFDTTAELPAGWQAEGPAGSIALTTDAPFDGTRALRVQRTDAQLNEALGVTGAAFAAGPGPWRVSGASRGTLYSPDNSFAVRLGIEALDGTGHPLERVTLVNQTGEQNWKAFARQVEFPKGTARARFVVAVSKTYGMCDIDGLSATPLDVASEEQLVERIVIGSDAVGNLFFPDDAPAFTLEVRSRRRLPPSERQALARVTDYWGAEQSSEQTVALTRDGLADGLFRYRGAVALPAGAIELGKYYELHVSLPLTGYADASEYSAFARLPEAESRRYPAQAIPFSIRNWDSRITEYVDLAGRIGHRLIGLWGASGYEHVIKQGNIWYSGSRAADVERDGFKTLSEEQLAKETTDFIRKYGDKGMAAMSLGNEPNERPEDIPEKVRAYKIVYDAVKAVKPEMPVVATSVPANEDFWKAGYYKYCDIFDFHVYETYEDVRQTIRRYKTLMRTYDVEKPVWCTELGLNSQGLTRYAVAGELVKKITAFFAEGGANVSWFTIMYPDRDGKARGTTGDAHNTFDCQYNQYNPRLDAIMYYNMINGITVKKVVDEVRYADGVQAYLFRDDEGNCLHVLWHENGRVDRAVPLPGVKNARLIRIDGSGVTLAPHDGNVTLGISSEPLLLRYRSKAATLARTLPPPALSIPEQPLTILKGKSRDVRLNGPDLKAGTLDVELPPRWTAQVRQHGADAVTCTITAPELTDARTGRVMVRRSAGTENRPCGEVILSLAIMSHVSADRRFAPGSPHDAKTGTCDDGGVHLKKLDMVGELVLE